jgi:hypothetical protein
VPKNGLAVISGSASSRPRRIVSTRTGQPIATSTYTTTLAPIARPWRLNTVAHSRPKLVTAAPYASTRPTITGTHSQTSSGWSGPDGGRVPAGAHGGVFPGVATQATLTAGSTASHGTSRNAARHLPQTIAAVFSGVVSSASRLPRARSSDRLVTAATLARSRPMLTCKAVMNAVIPCSAG